MNKESVQISLTEAEAMTLEVLDNYREQMLAIAKRELVLFSDELKRAAKTQFESARSAIEADHAKLRSSYLKSSVNSVTEHILWGICLTAEWTPKMRQVAKHLFTVIGERCYGVVKTEVFCGVQVAGGTASRGGSLDGRGRSTL